MSRLIAVAGPKYDALAELDIDELVDRLTPGEIQKLLDECDPDDPHIPPSMRSNYKCGKVSTGPLDRKKLLDYINDEALNTPDVVDPVPYVPNVVRGRKWVPPPKPAAAAAITDETIELDLDFGDEYEIALDTATAGDIVDLASILGLHSMINQDQFHLAAEKNQYTDPNIGWNSITKATPLKEYPSEEPNRTDPEAVISKARDGDATMKSANLNNVPVSENQFLQLFDALRHNETLEELSLANTTLGDFAVANCICALKDNKHLQKLNIESNNVSPQSLSKMFLALEDNQALTEVKASNQKAHFLGNKVEMAITVALENNKHLLKVGLHFEFSDCRNRVAVQLQKNLDRIRLKRVALKLQMQQDKKARPIANGGGSKTGGYLGALPGQLSSISRRKSISPDGDDDEYEYYDEEDEQEDEQAR